MVFYPNQVIFLDCFKIPTVSSALEGLELCPLRILHCPVKQGLSSDQIKPISLDRRTLVQTGKYPNQEIKSELF
jgi:hypothetical protein